MGAALPGVAPVQPARKVAVVACMDSRMPLFPLLGLEVGDAHVIRNAGGIITDDVLRSLTISQHLLGTRETVLVHHTDCGMQKTDDKALADAVEQATGHRPPWVGAPSPTSTPTSASRWHPAVHPYLVSHEVRGTVYDVTTRSAARGHPLLVGSRRAGCPLCVEVGVALVAAACWRVHEHRRRHREPGRDVGRAHHQQLGGTDDERPPAGQVTPAPAVGPGTGPRPAASRRHVADLGHQPGAHRLLLPQRPVRVGQQRRRALLRRRPGRPGARPVGLRRRLGQLRAGHRHQRHAGPGLGDERPRLRRGRRRGAQRHLPGARHRGLRAGRPARPRRDRGAVHRGSDSAGAPTETVQVWVPSGRMLAYAYLDAPSGGGADLATRQLTTSWPCCRASSPPRRTRCPTCPPTRWAWRRSRCRPPGTTPASPAPTTSRATCGWPSTRSWSASCSPPTGSRLVLPHLLRRGRGPGLRGVALHLPDLGADQRGLRGVRPARGDRLRRHRVRAAGHPRGALLRLRQRRRAASTSAATSATAATWPASTCWAWTPPTTTPR